MRSLLYALTVLSLPMRGAWIEIRLTPAEIEQVCRSPCGERGLKLQMVVILLLARLSLPMRGAWIEIDTAENIARAAKSLPMRGAWIEIHYW